MIDEVTSQYLTSIWVTGMNLDTQMKRQIRILRFFIWNKNLSDLRTNSTFIFKEQLAQILLKLCSNCIRFLTNILAVFTKGTLHLIISLTNFCEQQSMENSINFVAFLRVKRQIAWKYTLSDSSGAIISFGRRVTQRFKHVKGPTLVCAKHVKGWTKRTKKLTT